MDLTTRFQGWSPARVSSRNGEAMVEWYRMSEARFTDPFFRTTMDAVRRSPFNLAFGRRTPIATLSELRAAGRPSIEPTGFIFHMSRCGSTLVSQMLAALPLNMVLSEPPPVDQVLRIRRVDHPAAIESLQDIVHCLAEPRHGEKHLFIKFDPWNVLDLPLIRAAFPDVPWVFLYREPLEVLASQMRSPAASMMPGNITRPLQGFTIEQLFAMTREEYCARALALLCETALSQADDEYGLFLEYEELPGAVFYRLAGHFGLDLTDEDRDLMLAASRTNTKTADPNFRPDSEKKREEATDELRWAADEFIRPVYEELRRSSKT
jgi:hypothetical protein